MISRLPRVSDVRAALWTERAVRRARRRLAQGRVRQTGIPRPPALPASAGRAVEALLRRRRHTCLEGALVRQRWLEAHGVMRDVVIGVTGPAARFEAHAWLDDAGRPVATGPYAEIARLSP